LPTGNVAKGLAQTRSMKANTVVREVETVRARVGICDVTTLGKIDIQGRDALAFIERVCA
jgi:glycine cleavage system aminomethyltransferase T